MVKCTLNVGGTRFSETSVPVYHDSQFRILNHINFLPEACTTFSRR